MQSSGLSNMVAWHRKSATFPRSSSKVKYLTHSPPTSNNRPPQHQAPLQPTNNATQTRLPNLPQRLHRPSDPEIVPCHSLQISHNILVLVLLLLVKDIPVPEPDGARSAPEPMAALPQHDAAAREAD